MNKIGHDQQSIVLMVGCIFIVLFGCSKKAFEQNPTFIPGASDRTLRQECLKEARKLLGPEAEIVDYGTFNNPNMLEAVAVQRIKLTPSAHVKLPIEKLAVLHRDSSGWKSELSVSQYITNDNGYIAADFIDDGNPYYGYDLKIANERSDGKHGLVLYLTSLNSAGSPEGASIEIAWNHSVKRYQEFAYDNFPMNFKPENPIPKARQNAFPSQKFHPGVNRSGS